MSVTIEGLRSVSVKQAHFLIDKSVSDKWIEPFLCSSKYLATKGGTCYG